MFRHSLLPSACFGMALGVAAALPTQTHGQDRSTYERLDRLERDLNMLQRQVYRGGPAPMPGGGDPGVAMNAELRMDRIEQQMRELTGRVEEFTNQVERLRQRVEQGGGDADGRVSQAPPGPGGYAAAGPLSPPLRPRGSTVRDLPEPPGLAGGPLGPPDSGEPTPLSPPLALAPPRGAPTPSRGTGTLTPPGVPAAGPELAATAAPSTARPLPTGSASEQYNHAFGLLKQADYPAAESALKAFVEQHPNDAMAGNAQYWLGETYYTRGRFAEAASAFAEGYKRYPKSSKAPDELLKLGMALARANQKQNACIALTQLDHDFPAPGAAIKERANVEKKRLGC